jgi:hypothetical protein
MERENCDVEINVVKYGGTSSHYERSFSEQELSRFGLSLEYDEGDAKKIMDAFFGPSEIVGRRESTPPQAIQ